MGVIYKIPGTLMSAMWLAFVPSTPAFGQTSSTSAEVVPPETASPSDFDIIVTAQKRAQSINDVPLSMTVASGETLIQRGISSVADLAKIVPGLTVQPSPFNTPVYTLRGVGFYDSTLSASPTVAVYTDEIALPFSAMTKAAALDLERVEVLKGPQGTLFGQNTTGGAINYIAAKPTKVFSAGFNASYGRFNTADLQGFISGPLTDTVRARLAVRTVHASDWQKSYTRHDSLGSVNETQARLLLDWLPTDKFKITFNVNGWIDKSDTPAAQRIGNQLSVQQPRGLPTLAYPLAPKNARAADWTNTILPLKKDDYFVQGSVRADYDFTDAITLTSISSYQRYKTDAFQDFDGIALSIADVHSEGFINSLSQELRLAGTSSALNWVVGANYEKDKTFDELIYYFTDSTTADVGPFYIGGVPSRHNSRQSITTKAVFANVEYEILPNLRVQAGARYTDSKRTFSGCTYDIGPPFDDVLADAFEFLQSLFRVDGLVTDIPPGGCITLDANFHPISPALFGKLKENNVSWRGSVNYRTPNSGLVYATVSKGYKAGSFPTTATAKSDQFAPVIQESLLAYEVGFKQPLFDRRVQVNGALFYYDYKDKQLRGRILDPIFGPLDALVQVPKSQVKGAEAEISARPFDGLTLSVAATYIKTKIKKFVGYNSAAQLQDFAGSEFPYSPNWTVVSDAQYEFPLNASIEAFVGGGLTYNSIAQGSIGDVAILRLRPYTLIDVRAGVKSADEQWRFQLWGRNITNEYYWSNALQTQDGFVRYAGKPVTYGASVGYRF